MVLPEFWKFLEPGWWILHLLAVALIYLLGVGHGRKRALLDMERRMQHDTKPPSPSQDR